MNYLAILILVLVVFFGSKRKHLKPLSKENTNVGIFDKINDIKNNSTCIMSYRKSKEELLQIIKNSQTKYIILQATKDLDKIQKDVLIYNFILAGEETSGFSVQFDYDKKLKGLKKVVGGLIAACVNYAQLFSRKNIYTYSFVCAKKEDLVLSTKIVNEFALSEIFSCSLSQINLREYILRREALDLNSIANIVFVILAGSIVTANVLYNIVSVINLNGNMYDVISCALIYVCYANITSTVYSPLGKFKFIASYLFPLYIVLYTILSAYYYIKKLVGGIMNKKKNFFISLVILFIVYVIFILLKK